VRRSASSLWSSERISASRGSRELPNFSVPFHGELTGIHDQELISVFNRQLRSF
jgi:hypothetical protein